MNRKNVKSKVLTNSESFEISQNYLPQNNKTMLFLKKMLTLTIAFAMTLFVGNTSYSQQSKSKNKMTETALTTETHLATIDGKKLLSTNLRTL